MRRKVIPVLILSILSLGFSTSAHVQRDQSIETFWAKFKAAVIKGDRTAVAQMSQFPIEMTYGMPSIRTAAQLNKRYRQVFNGETDAARCFAEAKPEIDPQNSKRFSVACRIQNTGDFVIIYSFSRTRAGWKFNSLDNINE
jgi:hypothetical protein